MLAVVATLVHVDAMAHVAVPCSCKEQPGKLPASSSTVGLAVLKQRALCLPNKQLTISHLRQHCTYMRPFFHVGIHATGRHKTSHIRSRVYSLLSLMTDRAVILTFFLSFLATHSASWKHLVEERAEFPSRSTHGVRASHRYGPQLSLELHHQGACAAFTRTTSMRESEMEVPRLLLGQSQLQHNSAPESYAWWWACFQ